jgi:PTS system ascorbate-specific IIC component
MDEFLYFIKDFFGAPAILIAIFVFLGNLLIHKKFTDVIIATIKASAGYFALAAGAELMGTTLKPFTEGFKLLIPGTSAVLPNSDPLAAAILRQIPEVATVASLIMFFAIVLNVVLARTSKFKYIFLTGHHALYLSVALAIIFNFAGLSFTTDM